MHLREFLQDKKTKEFSATRLAMLVWVLGVFAVWAYVSVMRLTLQALPETVVTILGILVTGKAIQRFGER